MINNYRERAAFLRDFQLQGRGSYEQAVEIWNGAEEIAETFEHDGLRTVDDLAAVDIRDAVADWQAIRRAGL